MFLNSLLTTLIGTTVMVAGVSFSVGEIMDGARKAADAVSMHELRIALELYYSDHQTYPEVSGGDALTGVLLQGGYIQNTPFDVSRIRYEVRDGGEEYALRAGG